MKEAPNRNLIVLGLVAVFSFVFLFVTQLEKLPLMGKELPQAEPTSQPKTSDVVNEDLYRDSKVLKLDPVQDDLIPLEPNAPMPVPASKLATSQPTESKGYKSLLDIKLKQVDG